MLKKNTATKLENISWGKENDYAVHAFLQVRGFPAPGRPGHFGVAERGIDALVNPDRLMHMLVRMLDENEFMSP